MMPKDSISMVIADDHPMILKGLFEELTENGYPVLGQASNGEQALHFILDTKPRLALLDIEMPLLTGFEVIKKAREKNSETKFIVLSFHKETEYVSQAKALEINGYLLKEDTFYEIERCIDAVLNDREYYSRSFESFSLKTVSAEMKKLQHLTPSETTILKLISQQTSTSDIAETLFVSARTIEKHRSNIISKLDIEAGTNALTNWALVHKIVIMDM